VATVTRAFRRVKISWSVWAIALWAKVRATHARGHLPIRARTLRTEISGSALRSAVPKLLRKSTLRHPLAHRLLPPHRAFATHLRPHRERSAGTAFTALHRAFPRRAAIVVSEVGTRHILREALAAEAAGKTVMMTMHPRLRSVARRRTLRAFAPRVTFTAGGRLRAIAANAIARSTLIARTLGSGSAPAFTIALDILRAISVPRTTGTRAFRRGTAWAITVAADFTTGCLRALAIAARAFRARPLGTSFTARTLIPRPLGSRTLIAPAFRARTALALTTTFARTGLRSAFARTASLATRLWSLSVARRAHLIRSNAAVAVAVELAQHICGFGEFVLIDHAVVIRIERAEDARHRALPAAAGRTFATRSAFALRRLGRTLRWLIFLREERPRRKRERHCGGESSDSFHGFWVVRVGGSCRGVRRAFIGLNAARMPFCASS
jgi:hypothetical protein